MLEETTNTSLCAATRNAIRTTETMLADDRTDGRRSGLVAHISNLRCFLAYLERAAARGRDAIDAR
jgi:hypothetical protein